MIEINRILIQLNKAVEIANSEYPQEKSIAVTLFDNLIELQLLKRAESKFLLDRTTWYNGSRFHNTKIRNNAVRYFDNLLKFSKDNLLITERDFEILQYAHSIRNSVFHKGILDDLKIDLAILIYYDFIQRTFLKLGSPKFLIVFADLPGYKKIDFGQGLKEESLLEYKEYFISSLNYILSKLLITRNLAKTIQTILNKQIEKIEWSIKFIKSESRSLNFYNVLGRFWYLNSDFFEYFRAGRKPKNLDSILLLYAYLRTYQDYLDDIPDLKSRQNEGKKLLKKFRSGKNGKYPYWINLEKLKRRIENLEGKEPNIVLKNLIDIENKISYLYTDLDDASSDLDGYIMELQDRARGK